MDLRRRVRRKPDHNDMAAGPWESENVASEVRELDPDAPSRVLALQHSGRWLATLVAHLVSEDIESGATSSRIIVRLESLTRPNLEPRIVTFRASSLEDVNEVMLGAALRFRVRQSARSLGGET